MINLQHSLKSEMSWYLFYTAPRAEKVIYNNLMKLGYQAFLPVKKEMRVWSNRQRKIIETPLFPNYIFINTTKADIYELVKIPKICSCVKCNCEPVIVPHKTLEAIRIMIDMNKEISIETEFNLGDRVRIKDGPLLGQEGVLLLKKGRNQFGVLVDFFNSLVTIDLSTEVVEKVI